MNYLEKKAVKEDLIDKLRKKFVVGDKENLFIGGDSKFSRASQRGLGGLFGSVFGAPVRGAGNLGKNILFGRPAAYGPMRGKRLHPIAGGAGKGLEEIGRLEYEAIRRGEIPGKAVSGKLGGKDVFYKRKYGPRGITGFAMKHPVMTGLGALMTYYLTKSPENRQMVMGFMPAGFNTQPTQETAKQWSGASFENPMAKNVWGS
tara:strand:+ start:63 stop:671 length:609 start_codon:yes stop_codon:yes gene_type:complete